MNHYKMFAKNATVITIGQFSSKLLTFLLVPLYTNVLSTAEYGTNDIIIATIGLMVPVLTLNIFSSTQRFAMDDGANYDSILGYSLRCVAGGSIVFFAVLLINHVLGISKSLSEYWIVALTLFLLEAMVNVVSSFAIGINKVSIVAISGALCTFSTATLNILFLLVLRLRLTGFFLATVLALLVQLVFLCVSLKLWKYNYRQRDAVLFREMREFSMPLMLNSTAWWINSVSDRYVVTFFLGIEENGVYSVAYKIPSILNVFSTVFSQAWAISAVKSFDADDKEGFFSKMYSFYNAAMVMICAGLILLTRVIAKVMYAKDFFVAWRYVPFLLIASIFGALSGYLGGIFSANKESKVYSRSTVIGAICNIVLNIVLVYFIGALGAAISTAVSYMIVWLIRLLCCKKMIRIRIRYARDAIAYSLLVIQSVLLITTGSSTKAYLVQVLMVVVVMLLFVREVGWILGGVIKIFRRRKQVE